MMNKDVVQNGCGLYQRITFGEESQEPKLKGNPSTATSVSLLLLKCEAQSHTHTKQQPNSGMNVSNKSLNSD
jgi:hypothetical protein